MSADPITTAVGYLRVASGSARKRDRSVYLQRQAILRYAKMNRIRMARFFADHACISDITMRQGLSDAMAYIASGKASVLVVADLTRLSRNLEDLLCFVEQQRILTGGPALISVQEQIDTRTSEGLSMLGTIHALACWESSDLGSGV